VNRVGDRYFDQLERSGHASRIGDLDLIADLGIRTVRYPILWERTASHGPDTADWTWADERLERLQELGIDPIVGLIHHGSGPADTSLVDEEFPHRLAEFAQAVAQRYPWLRHFTPVNEPLTTARFSGLYGHWYPHGRDDATFLRTLVTQCRAVVLSMQAIREQIPTAALVQTEDIGRTTSTATLAYQAAFDNERRWLSLDLLHGTVNPEHALWTFLRDNGISDADLDWFLEHPCPPDIIGVNYYLTSERYLDENLASYPAWSHGGNSRQGYADVHSAVADGAVPINHADVLRDTWDRYHRPIAITEAHCGGTREGQLRWLMNIWESATELRADGVDLRAVTAWAMFGTYNWNNLVTSDTGFYEPGVYDVRSTPPRSTAVARLLRHVTGNQECDHPPSGSPWPFSLFAPQESWTYKVTDTVRPHHRPILIVGATGTLGKAFAILCADRQLAHVAVGRNEMDIADPQAVAATLASIRPWALINAAGYVRVDDAEYETTACYRENTHGATVLSRACADFGVRFVTFSSDLVFDGRKHSPYTEDDAVAPLGVYGRSKADAETQVLTIYPEAFIIRTSTFFGPWDTANFVTNTLRDLAEDRPVRAADDAFTSPTYIPDLVNTTLDLLIDDEHGLWHLANDGAVTWADFARQAADLAGLPVRLVHGCPTAALGLTAARPAYSVLGTRRGQILPSLDGALSRFMTTHEVTSRMSDARAVYQRS